MLEYDRMALARRLREAMDDAGVSNTALANALEVSVQAVGGWLSTGKIRRDRLPGIARVVRRSVDWLLTGVEAEQHRVDDVGSLGAAYYSRCPVVGTAQLGDGGYWHDLGYEPGNGDGYIDVPSADPNAYALRVRGDSMEPAIRDGWYVVIEPSASVSPGEYVMVQTTDGRCMVKELLWERGDQVALMSVNEAHGRLTLRRDEIEKMHHVAFIAPPSKRFL